MANGASNYKIIRVTPTLDTSAYAGGDVLFNATEIPEAVLGDNGCSKLLAMFMVNQNTTAIDIDFIFSENTGNLGTINATADISDSDLEAMNVTGLLKLDNDQSSTTALDTAKVSRVYNNAGTENVNPILLQAASGSTSVYVSAVLTTGTPTLAADDIDLIFHIQTK